MVVAIGARTHRQGDAPPLAAVAVGVGGHRRHEVHGIGSGNRVRVLDELTQGTLGGAVLGRIIVLVVGVGDDVEGEAEVHLGNYLTAHHHLGNVFGGSQVVGGVGNDAAATPVAGTVRTPGLGGRARVGVLVAQCAAPIAAGAVCLLGPDVTLVGTLIEAVMGRHRLGVHDHPVGAVADALEGILALGVGRSGANVSVGGIGDAIAIVPVELDRHPRHPLGVVQVGVAIDVLEHAPANDGELDRGNHDLREQPVAVSAKTGYHLRDVVG